MGEINIYIAKPHGFCAGVIRAVSIVEETLARYGAPIYVRHEIVHNKHVINNLKEKGVIFVDELDEVKDSRPIIFSAHGVALSVVQEARERKLLAIDATCPLVQKVHKQIKEFAEQNIEIIVIGKKNHPEIIGTVGQLRQYNKVHIINSVEEAKELTIDPEQVVGFVTQTTLSVDDTKDIISFLKSSFKNLKSLKENDICFATTNRQKAVKAVSEKAKCIIILGSKNSSNSNQLKNVALKSGAEMAMLIDDVSELDWESIKGFKDIGISAGASAPDYLIVDFIEAFKKRYDKIKTHDIIVSTESVNFKL